MKDDTLYLIHIFECILRIEKYTRDVDQDVFLKDSLRQDAVLRNLQILAESTQRLSSKFKDEHLGVEWSKISGLRNILVHDYLGLELETVWTIIVKKIPELKNIIKEHIPEIPQ